MSAWSPTMASCSCAAGRRVSSEAIRTFFFSRSLRRFAILAVDVVLPEPWRPTTRIGMGAAARRLIPSAAVPSVSTRWSWTILMTIWPGVTDFTTASPTAFSRTAATKSLTTGSATSASSSTTRTSRRAASTSASLRAPRRVRRSTTSPRRWLRLSNMSRSWGRRAPRIPEWVVDDLDAPLAGVDRFHHRLADRLLAHRGNEVLDHGQRHVGLEQHHAHLAQGRVDVGLAEGAAPGQAIEDVAEALAQALEHESLMGPWA